MLFQRVCLLALGITVLALLGLGWAFFQEDFDFGGARPGLSCATLPADSRPFRFILFGDYGMGTAFQRDLARQMAEHYKRTPFSAAFMSGDNIYPDGNVQQYGKSRFLDPYAPLLASGVRFWPALGNHDTKGGFQKDLMAFFRMPSEFYKVSYRDTDFFILNTTRFVHHPTQQAWLIQSLAKSRARWKIVIAHHPLYSSGRNGNTEGLREILEPILQKYGVDLYLSGHDHDYERFEAINGVRYVVSGGGGGYLTGFRTVRPGSLVRLKTHHFVLVEISGTRIGLKAINKHGTVVDCTDWKKPG